MGENQGSIARSGGLCGGTAKDNRLFVYAADALLADKAYDADERVLKRLEAQQCEPAPRQKNQFSNQKMKHKSFTNTIVVVDASLENYQQLIDGIRPGAKSFLLDLRSDGIKQISELLQQHKETEVLHLLSHGSPGCLYLGNSQLSLDTHQYQRKLPSQYCRGDFRNY